MSLPIFIGLGAATLLGAVIRKAEKDARTAIDLGCRCRDPKIQSLGAGRVGLGCACRWPNQRTTGAVSQDELFKFTQGGPK